MKMMMGFSAGVAAGIYISNKMSERQRTQIATRTSTVFPGTTDSAAKPLIGEPAVGNITKVADAASERIIDVVDSAGTSASAAVEGRDRSEHPQELHAAIS